MEDRRALSQFISAPPQLFEPPVLLIRFCREPRKAPPGAILERSSSVRLPLPQRGEGSCEKIWLGVLNRFGRDAVLHVRVGFSVADAQQRVPTIECFHSSRGWG